MKRQGRVLGKGGALLLGLWASLTWTAARGAIFDIERVSLAPGGGQLTTNSATPSISANGRFVVFSSSASNLVVGDTNNTTGLFLLDRNTGALERVSVTTNGTNGNGNSGESSVITANGQLVFFNSFASNLVPGHTNGTYDVFVRNRSLGTTERVSVAADGGSPNGSSGYPRRSARMGATSPSVPMPTTWSPMIPTVGLTSSSGIESYALPSE